MTVLSSYDGFAAPGLIEVAVTDDPAPCVTMDIEHIGKVAMPQPAEVIELAQALMECAEVLQSLLDGRSNGSN